MKKQLIENQKGEVEFRRKLYSQQVNNERIFDNEFDAAGIEIILKDRMRKTFDRMILIREKNKNIALSF